MPVSLCEDCQLAMIRDEIHSPAASKYTGTHIYCREIKLEVYGIIKSCSTYIYKNSYVRMEDL